MINLLLFSNSNCAGLENNIFLAYEVYDDQIFYQIVDAVCATLGKGIAISARLLRVQAHSSVHIFQQNV